MNLKIHRIEAKIKKKIRKDKKSFIGAEEGFYFEPLLQLLIDFNKFIKAYQAAEEENENI